MIKSNKNKPKTKNQMNFGQTDSVFDLSISYLHLIFESFFQFSGVCLIVLFYHGESNAVTELLV